MDAPAARQTNYQGSSALRHRLQGLQQRPASTMAGLFAELRRLVDVILDRVYSLLQAAPPGTFVTGVLGLAAVLVGYYQLRRTPPPGDAAQQRRRPQLPAGAAHGSNAASPSLTNQQQPGGSGSKACAASAAAGAAAAAWAASATPLGRSVRARLGGVRRVTLSVPGVLLEEWTPAQLQDGASLRPEAGELLTELAAVAEVFLLAHVSDDVGQAVVTGALEAAGLLGRGPGQVPPHRLLFCSTLTGKVSLVRQLEPGLHVDGHPATVSELRRFMPLLLQVVAPGDVSLGGDSGSGGNIVATSSLAAFFDPQGAMAAAQ